MQISNKQMEKTTNDKMQARGHSNRKTTLYTNSISFYDLVSLDFVYPISVL
jgi:hypothetical protein